MIATTANQHALDDASLAHPRSAVVPTIALGYSARFSTASNVSYE